MHPRKDEDLAQSMVNFALEAVTSQTGFEITNYCALHVNYRNGSFLSSIQEIHKCVFVSP